MANLPFFGQVTVGKGIYFYYTFPNMQSSFLLGINGNNIIVTLKELIPKLAQQSFCEDPLLETDCYVCLSLPGCGWCKSSGKCVQYFGDYPFSNPSCPNDLAESDQGMQKRFSK
jgi:hypothetical protein